MGLELMTTLEGMRRTEPGGLVSPQEPRNRCSLKLMSVPIMPRFSERFQGARGKVNCGGWISKVSAFDMTDGVYERCLDE
jgi:hypothetical protein